MPRAKQAEPKIGTFRFKPRLARLDVDGQQTWARKLAHLARTQAAVRIITYSLPDLTYIHGVLGKRPYDIQIICHEQFLARAKAIKQGYADIRIAVVPAVHSKILLIEPETLYITSANFGRSTWHETAIGCMSADAHDYYVQSSFNPLWKQARELVRSKS